MSSKKAKRPAKSKKPAARHTRSRRGKSEAMTGKSAGAVETRTPTLDLVVLDDDSFDMHFRSAKSAKERMNQAKQLYDGCCNAAKKVSDDMLAAVKRALKFDGMDADDIKRQMEIDGYVLRRANSPVQVSIFDALGGDVQKQAYTRGVRDAEASKGAESPYPAGSDLDKQYAKGHRHITADRLGVSRDDADAAVEGDGDQDSLLLPQPEGAGARELDAVH